VKAVAGAVGMAVTYAREFEQARQGRQWLEAAGDVTTELLGGGHTDRALTMIAGRAMELSAADTAMVLVPSDPGIDRSMVTDLRAAVCVGAGAGVLLDLMIPVKGSIAGAVLADQHARKVGSLAFHPNSTAAVLGPAMLAPLTPDTPAAALVVARAPGSAAFDDNDLTRLTAFAENAALALHLAQTERHRELRVLADRDRVARDLYDHVMQQLFAVGLALQITRRRPPSPNADSRMGEHIDQVQQVIREVRQAIFDLPPALTDPPHLRTSLTQLITSLTADAPQLISVRMTGPLDDLPADLARHTRGVLREAIGNALRHSHADELSITITVIDELIVEVTDDGIGTTNATEGNGLRTLRQRATDVAGTFTIDRPDTGGTHLVWTAPLP
jgi:signal transduction histidine kinase